MSVALSVALLITPAALHRIVWAGEDTEAVLAIGGRVTLLALLPLAMGMAGDFYVVLSRVLGSAGPAAIAATLVLAVPHRVLVCDGHWSSDCSAGVDS